MMGKSAAATVATKPSTERTERTTDGHVLAFHVKRCVETYFEKLDGQAPHELYELVLAEVERPLLEVVMTKTRGNISKAAQYLGLNRATLRKKLEKYGIPS